LKTPIYEKAKAESEKEWMKEMHGEETLLLMGAIWQNHQDIMWRELSLPPVQNK
jgi:hypothetical protein